MTFSLAEDKCHVPLDMICGCGTFMQLEFSPRVVRFLLPDEATLLEMSAAETRSKERPKVGVVHLFCCGHARHFVCVTCQVEPSRATAEQAAMWNGIACPVITVTVVDDSNHVCNPDACSMKGSQTTACQFVSFGHRTAKKPVFTPDGPVFLLIRRLRCKTHDGYFEFNKLGEDLLPPTQHLQPEVLRLGEV